MVRPVQGSNMRALSFICLVSLNICSSCSSIGTFYIVSIQDLKKEGLVVGDPMTEERKGLVCNSSIDGAARGVDNGFLEALKSAC